MESTLEGNWNVTLNLNKDLSHVKVFFTCDDESDSSVIQDILNKASGFIRTNLSHNALVGDGSNLGKMDDDIATGMNVTDAAHVIVNGLEKRKKEISVGKGVEMHALWLKRFLPAVLFKLMAKRGAIEAKK